MTTIPPVLDFSKHSNVLAEIFENDEWVKKEFANHCIEELKEFSAAFSSAFKHYSQLMEANPDDNQRKVVTGFVHGVFDDLITSVKLLISGKLIPSGNLMRQALEGIAVSTLCSSRRSLLVHKDKNQTVSISYFGKLMSNGQSSARLVQSNKALRNLKLNAPNLRISMDAIEDLMREVTRHHSFSHPSHDALLARVLIRDTDDPDLLSVTQFIGGTFDEDKIDLYKDWIGNRTALCKILPGVISVIVRELESP